MRFCKQVLKGYLLDMPCVTGDSIYPDCFSNARFGANMRIANASCCIYNSNASRLTHLGQTGSTHMSDTLQGRNACTTRVAGPICCWHWSLVFARRLGPRHAVGRAPMRRFSRGSAFTSFRTLKDLKFPKEQSENGPTPAGAPGLIQK